VPNRSASPRTRARLAGLALALALTGLAVPAAAAPADPAPAAETAPAPSPSRSADELSAVAAYWTPERMADARPAPVPADDGQGRAARAGTTPAGPPTGIPPTPPADRQPDVQPAPRQTTRGEEWNGDQSRPPATTTGKLFFTNPSGTVRSSCSASVVTSPNHNVIVTAGHCAYHHPEAVDLTSYWFTNWLFVPAYRDGQKPKGEWVVAEAFVPSPYIDRERGFQDWDMAAMAVLPNRQGRELAKVTGANGITFGITPGDQAVELFGYPADGFPAPEAKGERLWRCAGTTDQLGGEHGNRVEGYLLPCDLGHGTSGGPFVARYDPASGMGMVMSVASDRLNFRSGFVNGATFDDIAKAAYEAAASRSLREVYVPLGKRGKMITGFRVQNTGPEPTWAFIRWLREDGSLAQLADKRLAPGEGYTAPPAPADFEGGVQVAPLTFGHSLAVATNYIAEDGSVASSPAFEGGAATVRLPLLMRENSNITTRVLVQNTEPVEASIRLVYSDPAAGEDVAASDLRIPALGSRIFSQRGAYPSSGSPGRPRVFAGTIEATEGKVAATVIEESPGGLAAYGGFTPQDAGQQLAAPLIMHNNGGGDWTGVQVQNAGDFTASVMLEFGPNTAPRRPCPGFDTGRTTATVRIEKGQSHTFYQSSQGTEGDLFKSDCTYVGSARVISTGAEIVAVVNQTGPSGESAYEALPADRLTGEASLPIVQANNGGAPPGIRTGVQVMNAGSGDARPSLILAGHDRGRPNACTFDALSLTPPAPDDVLEDRSSYTWLLWNLDAFKAPGNCVFVGSGQLATSTGQGRLAVIVNQLYPPASAHDRLSTYVGVPR
jgi:V8-like Glu-specific endopeptidase